MRTGLIGLAMLAAFGLSACMDQNRMVTSPNPLLQSQESRDIRAWLNDSTLRYEGERTARMTSGRSVQVDEVTNTEYSRRGTYSRVHTTRIREDGRTVTRTSTGSWNVRDDQLCRNEHTVNGERVSYDDQETVCFPVVIEGDTIRVRDPNTGRSTVSRRT